VPKKGSYTNFFIFYVYRIFSDLDSLVKKIVMIIHDILKMSQVRQFVIDLSSPDMSLRKSKNRSIFIKELDEIDWSDSNKQIRLVVHNRFRSVMKPISSYVTVTSTRVSPPSVTDPISRRLLTMRRSRDHWNPFVQQFPITFP